MIRRVLCLVTLLLALPAAAQPVASSARVEESKGAARLSFELDSPVAAEAYVMAGPDRVIVDLPEVNFQLAPQPAGKSRGARVVSSFRYGLFAPGKSRIVVDLARPALARTESRTRADGGYVLQIDLSETDAATFAKAAKVAAQENVARNLLSDAPARVPPKSEVAPKPTVVIDPGHGGIDVGAQGGAHAEKDIVFAFAKVLRAQMENSGRYRVVLTRENDTFIPLAGRVKIAREAGADLFISIHADTLSESAGVSGATVYTVSDRASDRDAARLAEKENLADAAAGLEGQEDVNDVSDILFDLTRRETRTYSHVFARTLVNYWGEAGRLNKNPHRSAGFRVLKAPDVPSVLLELGYMSSERDLAALMKPEWRQRAAEAMVKAVDAFFGPRAGLQHGRAASAPH